MQHLHNGVFSHVGTVGTQMFRGSDMPVPLGMCYSRLGRRALVPCSVHRVVVCVDCATVVQICTHGLYVRVLLGW